MRVTDYILYGFILFLVGYNLLLTHYLAQSAAERAHLSNQILRNTATIMKYHQRRATHEQGAEISQKSYKSP